MTSSVQTSECVHDLREEDLPVPDPGKPRFPILTVGEVLSTPPPTYQVQGMLIDGSYSCICGSPEAGKTFFALDLGLHIAAGTPWGERRVIPGDVVYVAGEGRHGLRNRVAAWLHGHSSEVVRAVHDRFVVIPEPVQIADDHRALVEQLAERSRMPSLVILDTVADCSEGLEENSATDMGDFNRGCLAVREALGATVVVVHHTSKGADEARGSSALKGSIDTEILVKHVGGERLAVCKKMRDGERFDPIPFSLERVGLGTDEHGEPSTSCRVSLIDRATRPAEFHGEFHPDAWSILTSLSELHEGRGATGPELREATGILGSFHRHLKWLQERDYATSRGPRGQQQYCITTNGREALAS